jgi:hypothetical protein
MARTGLWEWDAYHGKRACFRLRGGLGAMAVRGKGGVVGVMVGEIKYAQNFFVTLIITTWAIEE